MIRRHQPRTGWQPLDWHDTLAGLPVLLVANGPSLAQVDASKLCGPGRVVIGINNAYPAVRPDIWVGMDDPACFEQALFHDPIPKVLRAGYRNAQFHGRALRGMPGVCFVEDDEKASFFGWGPEDVFEWSSNTMLTALQLAFWMGSRDIYFIGSDLSVADGDYADGNYLSPNERARNARLYACTLERLRNLHHDSGGGTRWRLTSCSEGSRLNEFLPYRPVPEVLGGIEAGVPKGRPKRHVLAQPVAVDAPEKKRHVVLVLRTGGEYRPEHADRLIGMVRHVSPTSPITLLTDAACAPTPTCPICSTSRTISGARLAGLVEQDGDVPPRRAAGRGHPVSRPRHHDQGPPGGILAAHGIGGHPVLHR